MYITEFRVVFIEYDIDYNNNEHIVRFHLFKVIVFLFGNT